jgi:hypothetical protein
MTTGGSGSPKGRACCAGRCSPSTPSGVCSHPWLPPDGPLAPICRRCITEVVNPERRRGLAVYPILPGAYLDQ